VTEAVPIDIDVAASMTIGGAKRTGSSKNLADFHHDKYDK
jgi:hypothetical protein